MFQATMDLPLGDIATSSIKPKCLSNSLFENGQFESKVGKADRLCRRQVRSLMTSL